jgi:hypothetical protein
LPDSGSGFSSSDEPGKTPAVNSKANPAAANLIEDLLAKAARHFAAT